nr:MAG TPA: hypothetical protein [Caudoviricetes sp.]
MANNTWKNYTQKSTALSDNDEVMLLDSTDEKNKRGLMSKFWDYVVDKMATAVISKLETDNKTIIGAINALNGKTLKSVIMSISGIQIKNSDPGFGYYSDSIKTNIPKGTTIVAVVLCGGFSAGVMVSSVNKNTFTLSCNNSGVLPINRSARIWYI